MQPNGVRVESIRILGPNNIHAYSPVIQAVLDIGRFEQISSADVPGFVEKLLEAVPELEEHACSVGRPGGFVERLRRGTWLPHITEHVAIALQNRLGFPVSFGRARGTGRTGVYRVVVQYEEEHAGEKTFECALRIVTALMGGEPLDIPQEIDRLFEETDSHRLGPSTRAIANAARALHIPCTRLTPNRGLLQLGYGVHHRLVQAAESSLTSAIAVDICQEKALTNQFLRKVGVPVPLGEVVWSAEEAWKVASKLGLPVVVKPEAGSQGRGVTVGVRNEQEMEAAFACARRYGRVLVERAITGADYRILVVGGRMVAAARRDPAQVVGDGTHTVEELVEEVNRDPRRRDGHASLLTRIRLDDLAELVLSQQGLTRSSVPEKGKVVRLRTNANLSTGGTATDVTDEVHPENVRLAELAADVVSLDIAGVDIIAQDITQPLDRQGGAVVEVNAAPGLRMHISPSEGKPRDVGKAIVRMLFPRGAPSRIPIVAVTGTNGKTTVTQLVSHLFATDKKCVGSTTTEGIYVGGRRISTGDCSGPVSARTILLHPQVEAAVLETARGGILRAGLAFDAADVAVVTNVTADHLGLGGIETIEELARVKQVVVEAVHRNGAAVLNAEDPLVCEMAAATRGRVVYFARKADHPVIAAQIASKGAAVYVSRGHIVLHDAEGARQLVELSRVGFTMGGRIGFQVSNALAAAAAGWAAGINPAMIARGLATFSPNELAPGRFNVFDAHGVEVVIDYAHNPAALNTLAEALDEMGYRPTVFVGGLPGDRRPEDLRESILATASFAQEWILHDLDDRRGQAPGAVPELLRAALPDGSSCHIAKSSRDALRLGWASVRPGDRLVVIADVVDELFEWLSEMGITPGADGECVSVPRRGLVEEATWPG
jgi:cyanophycin synthetase